MKKTTAAIELTWIDNFYSTCEVEGKTAEIKNRRKKLHEERIKLLESYKTPGELIFSLRETLTALPTGEEWKAKKQTWKRSVSRAFAKIEKYEGFALTFKGNIPKIQQKVQKEEPTELDKVRDLLTGMLGEVTVDEVISLIEKKVKEREEKIVPLREASEKKLRTEKARKVRELKAQLKALQAG